ncbi:MAG: hypothetical protein KZQ65_07535, partial [Candidatus Thiodiazotropha sp. (ex Gloverina cf. vestifex)]|nr:hypothetical protein [Candidatus Thiodiazotropha sp. (ex Gloverina cf. vestifex)]
LFASWGLYNDWPRMCTIIPQSMDSFRASLMVLMITLSISLWLAGRERSAESDVTVRQGRTLHSDLP